MRRNHGGVRGVVVLLALLAGACGADDSWDAPFRTSVPSGSKLPPRVFQFVEVIPLDGLEPSGWQIACVHALVGQGVPDQPYATSFVCDIQVETPLRTQNQGLITRRKAQYAAAAAANDAAYEVLQTTVGVSEMTCKKIRETMQALLQDRIKGSIVKKCEPLKGPNGPVVAPPVTWP